MTKKLFLFILLALLFINKSQIKAQTVFINEIHYDNASTDVNEAIEVAGPAGTNLSGWSIILYNGSGGAPYGTTALNGSIPNQQNGYGTIVISYPSNGIQNGSPDGIALVDASNNVVQFLSYEGAFTAVGGAANGLVSTDIGVSETGTEPVGNSLQLVGTGTVYTDFHWQSPSASSQGNVNTGQSFKVATIPLLINEFVLNHTGPNTDEFVEFYSNPNTDLSGYSLIVIDGEASSAGVVDNVIQLGTTDALGYYKTPFYSDVFKNGTLSLLVVKNFTGAVGEDLDTNNDGIFDVTPWEIIADDVAVNDGEVGDISYSTTVLMPNFDGTNTVVGGASRIPNGTDTNTVADWVRNDFNGQGLPSFPNAIAKNGVAINTPGAENKVAKVIVTANIIINEVDADTPGSDSLDFVELYDGGIGNVPLDGYTVVFYNGNGDVSYAAFDLTGHSTNAEGYFVLGNSAVKNVGMVFSNNFLQNGADAVALYKGTASQFPNGTPVTLTDLADAIVYDTDDADDAGLLILLNTGQPQVNEAEQGNSAGQSMQRIPNGGGGARNTSTYTLLSPTPGAANGGTIPSQTISIIAARNISDGTNVTVTGILTVSYQFKGPAYLQDATGGIAVYDAKVFGKGLFNIGDSVTVTGTKTTYNGQTEISPVTLVVNNGLPISSIIPANITLSQMSLHPDELVKISNPIFQHPGDMFFGNSNYPISDVSGNGEIRIDADAPGLAGLAQPETCSEIIGIAGRYNSLFQLIPRVPFDMGCASKFHQSGNDGNISKELTLDVAAWNIEWFGDEGNSPAAGSPNSDQIQKDSVKKVLLALDADIVGVEEVSDDALFAQMVSEMPGYSFVLSNATSYPNETGVKQKVGFIYKTSTITPVSTKVLLASIHPYYNGGNTSYLGNYPDDPTRFYASGRLPFMLTADVNINGSTKRVSFIELHARANGSDNPQLLYDMRKFDVEVLKDTLDTYYPTENLIMVGDYNDDVDVTVSNVSTTVSSYQAYVNDSLNYKIVTSELSAAGLRSYVFEKDVIDHIMLSNELKNNYIKGSVKVHYEFYDWAYTNTTSDHLPVSARLQLQLLELAGINKTDVSCFGKNDGTATATAKGGIAPYKYIWNDSQIGQTITNLAPGVYKVAISDATGDSVISMVTIGEPTPLTINLGGTKTVYYGYPSSACTNLSPTEVVGGTPAYSYEWSTGEISQSIHVCPTQTSTYTLTVTDSKDCSSNSSVDVKVIDVRCSIGRIPSVIICYRGFSLCAPVQLVPYLLPFGVTLGRCNQSKSALIQEVESFQQMQELTTNQAKLFPNPFKNQLNINIESEFSKDVEFLIYSTAAQLIRSESRSVLKGQNKVELDLDDLKPGTYILRTIGLGVRDFNARIIKQE